VKRAALLAPLLLAGCTVGPDYHGPRSQLAASPAATGPFNAAADPAFTQDPLPDHWWRLYNDPRLDGYVEEALTANTDLRTADANLARASQIVREAQNAKGLGGKVTAGAYAAQVGGYTLTIPLDLTYSAVGGVAIDYPLDLAGGLKRGIEAARDNREAVEAARDNVRVTVAAAVAKTYADVCSANVTLTATQRVLAAENKSLDSIHRLFQGGRGTAFDVTRAKTAADRTTAAIPEILAARQAALYELAALMGRAPSDYPRDLETCATPPHLTTAIPVGDGSALLRRRPDVRAADRQLAAATAQIGIETARLYPQVALAGEGGLANSIASIFAGGSFGGLIGPMISWDFPFRAGTRARIAAAGDQAQAAEAHFDGTVIEALRQTETALNAYAREIEHDRALEKTRDDAQHQSEQADKLFRFGRTDVLSLLTAEANLAEAEAALAQSRAQLIDRQVNVFLALGGGWENLPPTHTPAPATTPGPYDTAAPGVQKK